MKLTQERVRELFDYREDGVLVRRVSTSPTARKGEVITRRHNEGYVLVKIDKKEYRVHRIVWLWHHGYLPENVVDHINHIKDDNRIENLREVTQKCNLRNSKVSAKNTSGVRGVHYDKRSGKWGAQIKVDNKGINLGLFNDKITAAMIRFESEVEVGWNECNEDSTAYNYLVSQKGEDWVKKKIAALVPNKSI